MKRVTTIALIILLGATLYSQQLWEISFKEGKLTGQGYYTKNKLKHQKVDAIEQWLQQIEQTNSTGKTLVFFHAMWGSNATFFKRNLKYFQDKLIGKSVARVVFVKWKAPHLRYKKNVLRTLEYGNQIATSLNSLFEILNPDSTIVMTHSMGTRIFWGYSEQNNVKFQKLILFAPDISNQEFIIHPTISNSQATTYLFYNKNDRFLKWSERILRTDRLGKNPNENSLNKTTSLNCSNLSDQKGMGGTFSGHIYYLNSASTVILLKEVLLNN